MFNKTNYSISTFKAKITGKLIITYILAAILPMVFMGSTLTFTPFACLENSKGAFSPDSKKGKTIEKDFTTSKGKRLDIELKTGGSIEISGWDKNTIHVKARIRGRDWENTAFDFKETSSGLVISSDYDDDYDNTSANIDLEINVPDEYNIDMETMGGDITLNNIKGKFSGKTMGGGLDLSKLKGEIDLTTMGGEIRLVDSDLDGSVHTMGGNVIIKDVTGNVKGSSMGGNVSLKNVTRREGSSSGDEVVISSMGGNIDVDNAPAGANVNTMGGNISINSAGKFVRAKTMGGNIVISSVDGGVKATTMGGDVDVKVTGSDNGDKNIDLTSMSGDIYLTVPKDFSMDIEISLAYTDDYDENDFKIQSDFNLKQERSDAWESDRGGSPRKHIYSTGKTGDAKNKVKIETVNGNIILKRG